MNEFDKYQIKYNITKDRFELMFEIQLCLSD